MQAEMIAKSLHIYPDKRFSGWQIEDFLVRQLRLPESFVRRLFHLSLVRLGRQVAASNQVLTVGAKLVIQDQTLVNLDKFSFLIDQMPHILYEDDHVLVVDKAAGIIIHSDNPDEVTLDAQVASYYRLTGQNVPVLHVHRLDKPTTGAVVYAKHGLMARALDTQLTRHEMQRRYLAVVCGERLAQVQTVAKPIGRDRHQAGRYRVSEGGKPAQTQLTVHAQSNDRAKTLSLLTCQLETGRTHQIRVHTASLGAPIVGDGLYGGEANVAGWPIAGAIGLHAMRVIFYHPYADEQIAVTSPPDDGWMAFLRQEWSIDDITWLSE